jgi:hypothetical protein
VAGVGKIRDNDTPAANEGFPFLRLRVNSSAELCFKSRS